jgi:hypothetical protein
LDRGELAEGGRGCPRVSAAAPGLSEEQRDGGMPGMLGQELVRGARGSRRVALEKCGDPDERYVQCTALRQ